MTTAALQSLDRRTLDLIAAMGAADPRAADIENDTRLAYLASIAGAAPEITENGYRGYVQIMTDLTSSSHWRRKRINCLATARRAKLKRSRSVLMWLGKAADFRREEQFSLHLERSRAALACIDANISMMAAE